MSYRCSEQNLLQPCVTGNKEEEGLEELLVGEGKVRLQAKPKRWEGLEEDEWFLESKG